MRIMYTFMIAFIPFELLFRMLRSNLKHWLCYLKNCEKKMYLIKFFPLNMHKAVSFC